MWISLKQISLIALRIFISDKISPYSLVPSETKSIHLHFFARNCPSRTNLLTPLRYNPVLVLTNPTTCPHFSLSCASSNQFSTHIFLRSPAILSRHRSRGSPSCLFLIGISSHTSISVWEEICLLRWLSQWSLLDFISFIMLASAYSSSNSLFVLILCCSGIQWVVGLKTFIRIFLSHVVLHFRLLLFTSFYRTSLPVFITVLYLRPSC